jgi:flagellar biosynthesis chaperone FliJ
MENELKKQLAELQSELNDANKTIRDLLRERAEYIVKAKRKTA